METETKQIKRKGRPPKFQNKQAALDHYKTSQREKQRELWRIYNLYKQGKLVLVE